MSKVFEKLGTSLYPDRPGFKAGGPSQLAADAIAPIAKTLRDKVLAVIADAPAGLTADEIAARLDKSPFSIRPRVSELNQFGEIQQSGVRRKNDSGMSAVVWVVAPKLGYGE